MSAPFAFSRGGRTRVMGILNLTPDSFSDGGRWLAPEAAVAHALEMEAAGADLIDVGGQSTRPGHTPISPEEEWARIEPVLRALAGRLRAPISVDTFFPQVAERALGLGARVVNDVGGAVSPEMARVVAAHGAGWVIMHAADVTASPDAVRAVRDWLRAAARSAEELGVPRERVCLDPGVGFGKTAAQNYALLRCTAQVRDPPYAYLVGASRKRCIGLPLGDAPAETRDPGTHAAHTVAICGGADYVRVHDVAGAVQAARVADAVLGRVELGRE